MVAVDSNPNANYGCIHGAWKALQWRYCCNCFILPERPTMLFKLGTCFVVIYMECDITRSSDGKTSNNLVLGYSSRQ